jgi:hypothetical protein
MLDTCFCVLVTVGTVYLLSTDVFLSTTVVDGTLILMVAPFVVAKQISIPRMMASERYYETKLGQKKLILSPWREVRSGLPSLSSAVAEMKKIIVGEGGRIVEDNEGNLIEQDPLPNLSPEAKGVQRADKVFNQFVGREPIKPIKQPPVLRPPVEDVEPDAQASSLAKRIIRSLNENV